MIKFINTIVLCICMQFGISQSLKQLVVQNGSISYYSVGEGETIIFIHGSQEDYRVFMPQIELLGDQYKVVTYSRRYNFPNDNKIVGDYNIKSEAKDLKILIETLGNPVHLVGHSYGGLIALELALVNPNMVRSLILSEPALVDWLHDIPECQTSYQDVQEYLIKDTRNAFLTGDTTKVLKEIFEFFAGADIQDQVPPEVLDMLKANLREMEALVTSSIGLKAPTPENIKTLKMPIMILTAQMTMPMLKCTNAKLIEINPQATHHNVMNAGHEMWMTHPIELSNIILGFIN